MFKSKLWCNKYFRYLIIFSLLLHALFYVLFFNVSFHKRSKTMIQGLWESIALAPEERQQRKEQREKLFKKLQEIKHEREKDHPIKDNGLQAKLRPKKSDFGWVYFEDVPSVAPITQKTHIQVPTTESGVVAQAPVPHATELIPVKPEQEAPLTPLKTPEPKETQLKPPELQKPPSPDIQEKEHEKILAQIVSKEPRTEKQLKRELQARNTSSAIESLIDELSTSTQDEQQTTIDQSDIQVFQEPDIPVTVSPDIQARIDKIARRQEQINNFAPTPTEPGVVATATVRGAKSLHKKDARGIIALTKGFVENIKDEGEDAIERDGDPNKRPSFEEMKYISYESNINWCLQAAWKQNFAYNSTVRVRDGKAIIEFTINTKGLVVNSQLLQSTGYQELDKIIMKNLALASPFPQLPKHFGVDTYTTGRIIHVFCNSRFGL